MIYTSFIRENETENSPISFVSEAHLKTENWLKNSGMKYTILKHTIYADLIPMFLGEQLVETGVAYLPAGEGRNSFVTRNDMAKVGAKILTTKGHVNKEYNITNEENISINEIVTEIAKITGKSIQYISPTQKEYIQTLTQAGVPSEFITMFSGFAEAFEQEEFIKTGTTIQTLTGKKPTSVKQFLKQTYSNI